MSIIRRFPWRVQPQGPVSVDQAKAASTGTIYLFLANTGLYLRDSVGGKHATISAASSVTTEGLALSLSGAQQQNLSFPLPTAEQYGQGLVVCGRILATAAQAGTPGAAFGIYSSSAQHGFGIGSNPSNAFGATGLSSSGASLQASSAGVLNKWYTIYAKITGISNQLFYAWIDGLPATTGQGSSLVGVAPVLNELSIGAQHRSTGFLRNFTGQISWATVLRVPSEESFGDAQAAALYKSGYPYNIFTQTRRIWVTGAAAGGSTGTLATTNANDTSAASGTTTVTGTFAKTNANDTVAASGTTTVVGTLAKTNANDTSAASGTVGSSGSSGTVAYTNANDTSAAAGTTTVTGTVARTNANDSVVASGWAGTISGTLAYTNANDTSSASGSGGAVEVSFSTGGGIIPQRRRTKEEIDDDRRRLGILPPEIQTGIVNVSHEPRKTITLEHMIGKPRASIGHVDLTQADAAHRKRKRKQDDELLMLM